MICKQYFKNAIYWKLKPCVYVVYPSTNFMVMHKLS